MGKVDVLINSVANASVLLVLNYSLRNVSNCIWIVSEHWGVVVWLLVNSKVGRDLQSRPSTFYLLPSSLFIPSCLLITFSSWVLNTQFARRGRISLRTPLRTGLIYFTRKEFLPSVGVVTDRLLCYFCLMY